MARWASFVERRRGERAVLVVDSGDFSLAPNARKREVTERYFFEGMKLLGYDAVGIGEAETRAGLSDRLAAAKRYRIPLVSSNVFDRALKKPAAPESIVRDIGGSRTLFGRRGAVRVGVFSVVLPSFVYGDGGDAARIYDVIDPKLAALAAATNLRARGCDLVIAISHLGWGNSLELAREVPGIDLVLNGHREHKRPCVARGGSAIVVDTGEKEWSFTEVSVTFDGDSLAVVAADACGAALSLREDPRFIALQEKYAEEIRWRPSKTKPSGNR
jgi:2',3'-cyclic-nucleotide 2'-phosphodiesterase (5'-nucleotidase family)